MAAEIEAAGGTVEKFAGDAVMAAFGAPAAHEDDAERALHAALSMRRRLEALFGGALSLRIGVNTGPVVVGRPRTRAAVEESLATPCVRGARSLLVCAAACAALDDDPEARALENEAARLGMEGFGSIIDTPRLRRALHRHDLATVRLLVSAWTDVIPRRAVWYFPAAVGTLLDALAALGETARLEEEAVKFLEDESALQPFALRALGIVRGDRALLRRAADRFRALGFERQAADTRVLA
jgi:hypothetical protein